MALLLMGLTDACDIKDLGDKLDPSLERCIVMYQFSANLGKL